MRNVAHPAILAIALSVLQACGGSGDSSSPVNNVGNDGSGSGSGSGSGTDAVAASIDSFVIDARLRLTPLGSSEYVTFPVALFKDGRALTSSRGLIDPRGLDAHRAANPSDWTSWRRAGGRVELLRSDGNWKAVPDGDPIPVRTGSLSLNAAYKTIYASSNQGTIAFTSSTEYTFLANGEVGLTVLNIGSFDPVGGPASGFFSSLDPDQRGRYSIQGYRMRVDLDSGETGEHVLIANPAKSDYIYIDDKLYWLAD